MRDAREPDGERTGADRRPLAVFSGGGTGGHLYPALALADALRERRPDVRVLFVGAERGLEARVLPERDEDHLLLPVVGFARDEPIWRRLRAVGPLLRSVRTALRRFRRLRPAVAVVTGGYAGGPAGLAALLTGVPLVVQEQNAEPGLVTRALSVGARQVHLAFPEAAERLPRRGRRNARVSGNPVRPPEQRDRRRDRRAFGLDPDAPVVLVVGGSQGSRPLNRLVAAAVRDVDAGRLSRPDDLQLLWSTGPAHLDAVREALGAGERPWVRTVGYIDDMPAALSAADLAVSRAGAMATAEFLAWELPAVLVPLPGSAADHQSRNAAALEAGGAAVHLPQEGLEAGELWRALAGLVSEPARLASMARRAAGRGRPGAAHEIAREIGALIPASGAADGKQDRARPPDPDPDDGAEPGRRADREPGEGGPR